MEKEIRKKRIRRIALAAVIIVCAAAAFWHTDFEYADYGKALDGQIEKAQELASDADTGNREGEYAPYTVLDFRAQIKTAEKTADDKNSEYDKEKSAYEKLKKQIGTFRKSRNSQCISSAEMRELIKSGKTSVYKTDISKNKEIKWEFTGKNFSKARDINLKAETEGPYYEKLLKCLEKNELQGETISLYQQGSFGGKAKISLPVYADGKNTVYVYRFDNRKSKLIYAGKGRISGGKAVFSVSEGGDYAILLAETDSGKDSTAEKEKNSQKESEGSSDTGSSEKSADSSGITVTIEIRCTTYSGHRDPILSKTSYTAEAGKSVYDVLYTVCRNKDIQMEARYDSTYGSTYVKGIDNLYEYDEGSLSGWMYKVNGTYPDYGCSAYKLKDGDAIVWAYTCDGGEDLGKAIP